MAERSFSKRLWYDFLRVVCRLAGVVCFRIRARDRQQVPASGGALILSNHQSHFDPVLIGLSCDRRLNYLARESLFGFAPFRWLIQSLDAIPIDREGMGLGGLKETLRRLKRGEIVLIFPEGRRTSEGQVAALKPGFCALARRAHVPLVPVAIDGAFDAWPRRQMLPSTALIHIEYGPPLYPEQIAQLDDQQLVDEMETRLRTCHDRAARSRRLASRGL